MPLSLKNTKEKLFQVYSLSEEVSLGVVLKKFLYTPFLSSVLLSSHHKRTKLACSISLML
jgi:hypothetical protein